MKAAASSSGLRFAERRVVPFSRAFFFDVVADVASYERFLPWCTRSRIVTPRGSSQCFDAELTVGFFPFSESYVSRVVLEPSRRVSASLLRPSPALTALSNDWVLEDAPGGGTRVDFSVEVEFRSQHVASVGRVFFGEVHSRMLGAFLDRASALQRTRRLTNEA